MGGGEEAFDLKRDFSLSSYQIMGKSSICLELRLLLLLQEMHRAENLFAPYRLPLAASNGFDMDNVVVSVTKGGGVLKKARRLPIEKEGGRVK